MSEHLHSNCDTLLQTLSDYIDDELSEEMCTEIQQHLESCGDCRVVLNTTRRTIDLVRIPVGGETTLPDDVRQRLFRCLELERFLKPPAS
jgi:predicted anti-sigma-YlaC factor YlaD